MAELIKELEQRLRSGGMSSWPEDIFNSLALEAFAEQFHSIVPYRRFCEGRGTTPSSVCRWTEVPAVPTTAFKFIDLVAEKAEVVFRTSGTSLGKQRRGRHLVRSLALYRASLVPPFRKYVMADTERIRVLSLIPPPRAVPDSSLSYMVEVVVDQFATESHWLVGARGELDTTMVRSLMRTVSDAGEPVLIVGTALSFLHLIDFLKEGVHPPLPIGSRIMETGGFKSSSRQTTRDELRQRLFDVTGIPTDRVVNEYGMTELLSQMYEPVLKEGPETAGTHVAPPWLRVRALDPLTLEGLPPGEEGLLAFFDLANVGSICHILTEDVGSVIEGRVQLVGRVLGAEPRGCSRAMDELMSAANTL